MTLVFTDLVGSTRLKEELGNAQAVRLIQEHHFQVRRLLREFPEGYEISTAGDSFFLAFRRPSDAVAFALRLQVELHQWNQTQARPLSDRIGIHAGEVVIESDDSREIHDLHGLEVDKCARVMSLGRANQVLLTRFAFENARASLKGKTIPGVTEVVWHSHGLYQLKGVSELIEVCEVTEKALSNLAPPEDSEKAKRAVTPADAVPPPAETPRGWRRWTAGHRIPTRAARIGAGLTAAAGLFALVFPLFQPLTDLSYDLSYLVRRAEPPRDGVIVRMDRPSHDQLGQPWMGAWDRRLHADLIERLREFGARAIVFDVLFDRPMTNNPAQDEALIAAAQRHGRVAVAGIQTDDSRGGVVIGTYSQGPFPELAKVTRWGLVERSGSDRTIRHAVRGTPAKDTLARETVRLLGLEPSSPPGNTWLNYYGPPGTIPSFPYSDVLSNLVAATMFTNKIVFVGAVYDLAYTGGVGTDDFATPYTHWTDGRKSPGVEIIATSTLNQIRNESLRRLPAWAEALLVISLGLAFGYLLSRLRPLPAFVVAVTAAALLSATAISLVWVTLIWFPWLTVSAVELPIACAWSAILWANNGPTPSSTSAGRRTTVKP